MGNTKEWYQKNKSMVIERSKTWKKNNPERVREIRRKDHRKAKGAINPHGETKIGPCELCGKVTRLDYDHDHINGEFRGWLCNPCNVALGWYEKFLREGWVSKFKKYLS